MARFKFRPLTTKKGKALSGTALVILVCIMLSGVFLYPGNLITVKAEWADTEFTDSVTHISTVYLRDIDGNATICTFRQDLDETEANISLGHTIGWISITTDVNADFEENVSEEFIFADLEWCGVNVTIISPHGVATDLGDLSYISSLDFGDFIGIAWGKAVNYSMNEIGEYTIIVTWWAYLGV